MHQRAALQRPRPLLDRFRGTAQAVSIGKVAVAAD